MICIGMSVARFAHEYQKEGAGSTGLGLCVADGAKNLSFFLTGDVS
jgi:hypothetical protein